MNRLAGRQLQASDGGCGGGIAGVRSNDGEGNICCVEECGVCGGTGCSTAGGDGYDHTHCCVTSIESSGLMCDETGAAPCILEDGECMLSFLFGPSAASTAPPRFVLVEHSISMYI